MIHKRSINLILRKDHVAPLSYRLNHVAMRVAIVSLAVFFCTVLFTVIYLRIQYDRFNSLKQEVQDLESGISRRKTVEGLATIAQEKLVVLERLNGINRRYSRLLKETIDLQSPSVRISQITVSKDRNMSMSAVSQSSDALEEFVDSLIREEARGKFSDITATGILRDRSGSYGFTLNMRPDVTLFQEL